MTMDTLYRTSYILINRASIFVRIQLTLSSELCGTHRTTELFVTLSFIQMVPKGVLCCKVSFAKNTNVLFVQKTFLSFLMLFEVFLSIEGFTTWFWTLELSSFFSELTLLSICFLS